MGMMLSELVPDAGFRTDVEIAGLSEDSRAVRTGDLFIALKGLSADGNQHIADAMANGAAAVLSDKDVVSDNTHTETAYSGTGSAARVCEVVGYPALREKLGHIASRFFGFPSQQMRVVAVTGTNGKTSFTQLLAQSLGALGLRCGTIGTMGYGLPGALKNPG